MRIPTLWKTSMLISILLVFNGWESVTSVTYTSIGDCNDAFSVAYEFEPDLKRCDDHCMNQTIRFEFQMVLAELSLAILESNHINSGSDRMGNYLSDNFKYIYSNGTELKRDQIVNYWKSLSNGERVLITSGNFEQTVIRNDSVAYRGFVIAPPNNDKQNSSIVFSPKNRKLLEIDERKIPVIPVDDE